MFEIRVNGEMVKRFDEQVTGVSLHSARGENYKMGVSNEGVVDVRVEVVRPGDPPRLDQLEALQRRAAQELVEGQISGPALSPDDPSMKMLQSLPGYTHQPGGVKHSRAKSIVPPSVDLAQGLGGIDTTDERYQATVNARIAAFNDHGDAQRAVDENPLQSNGSSFDLTGTETEPVS